MTHMCSHIHAHTAHALPHAHIRVNTHVHNTCMHARTRYNEIVCMQGEPCAWRRGTGARASPRPAAPRHTPRGKSKSQSARGGKGGKKNRVEHSPNSSRVCFAFRDKSSCKYGDSCKFSHSAVASPKRSRGATVSYTHLTLPTNREV